ncbi:hypothetical protein HELRODRAFT_86230, partial [Helobdella robusta]|uniref:YAP binding domain-containing protein n=1 Tax=Helobdella robusta TaxID=6412 RepID=T1G688_HELRO
YEHSDNITINISTKICSFGKQVIEKVEMVSTKSEATATTFSNDRSCMCEYMVNFINKLKKLPSTELMNSVLDNFTVIQVIKDNSSNKLLLCVVMLFEVGASNQQPTVYQIKR